MDGELAPDLEGGESPTENDGRFTHEFVVPEVAAGTTICDQAMLSGPGAGGDFEPQYSERLCLVVGSPTDGGDAGGGHEVEGPAAPPSEEDRELSPAAPAPTSPPAPPSGSPPPAASPPGPVSAPPSTVSPPAALAPDTPSSEVAPRLDLHAGERGDNSAALPAPAPGPGAPSPSPRPVPELARTGWDGTLVNIASLALATGGALLACRGTGRRRKNSS